MSNKLTGIKQWAWIGIIIGILSTIFLILGALFLALRFTENIKEPINRLEILSITIGIFGLLTLIGGIQLLRLKESGRKIYLYIAFGIILYDIYRFIFGLFITNINNKLDWSAGLIIQLILPIWIIYYFTRPKVKEQFK